MVFQVNEAFLAKLAGKPAGGIDMDQVVDQPIEEHLHCRTAGKAALFDMSFLTQIRFHGKDCVEFLEKILVGDMAGLEPGKGVLSILTNENGGIVDDTIITNTGDHFVMTIHDKYEDHFKEQLDAFEGEVFMEYFHDSILALQGPGAHGILDSLLPVELDLDYLPFMSSRNAVLTTGETCRIARAGFTGEDGFEIYIPSQTDALSIATKLLENENVKPAGLQALMSLRFEAGLFAKGKELKESVTPIEARLGWTIPRRRRQEGGFLGADKLLTSDGKLKKPARKCVGIMCSSLVPEENTEVFDANGDVKIGDVTSAEFSPCMETPLAMAFVESSQSKPGTQIILKTTIDGEEQKTIKALVVKLPFVETSFYQMPEPPAPEPVTVKEDRRAVFRSSARRRSTMGEALDTHWIFGSVPKLI